ncbi:MAG: Gfo/Idh/MocA family oxidoreductase [Candidatus Latescibacterota bacterium]
MLKLVLIGAGFHSRSNHGPSLARYAVDHPGAIELSAVCDLDLEKARSFQDAFGFGKVYADFEKMIARERPDACVCVMPIDRVAPMGIDLLERGLPVLLEKPPGIDIKEVRCLAEVARRTGVPHMVSANRRFDPCLRRGMEWARAQGSFRVIRAAMMRDRRGETDFMWGTAFHCVDALREIAGEVAHLGIHPMREGHAPWFHLDLKFHAGGTGSLDILPTCGCTEEKYEILGDDFRAEIWVGSNPNPMVRCWRENKVVLEEQLPADLPGFIRGGAYAETESFIRALSEGRSPRPSLADVLPSAEICFQCASAERS